ncbi:WD40 repeat domain-containing protein, partial [Mastigocoleus testarum]
AKVWDTTGKLLATLKGHTEAVSDANFSPVSAASPKGIGKTIVTASDDNTAKVWDTSGKLLATLKGHTGSVSDANFSPNGKTIITASLDNTAKVWHVKNLTEMLNIGCEWLNNYLIINPKKLQKLEVCQNKSNLKAAAPFLVQLGEKEAKAGNFEDAVATFKTALKWNRQLKLDPQKKAQLFENQGKAEQLVSEGQSIAQEGEIENAVAKFEEALQLDPKLDIKAVAKGLVNNANILVEQKKIKEAIKTYKQAQKLDPTVEINADTWNQLCRQGGLNGSAKEVMFACENAVKLAPNHGYIRYSRGLARALTGDYKGAIADLKILIAQTNNKENKAQRQGWVKALREGKNPFTKEVLEKLRNEG